MRTQKRRARDDDHAQAMRHLAEKERAALDARRAQNDEELRRFGAVKELGVESGYELASEHAHSNIVLIAHNSFKMGPEGQWHTWIDYDKFTELANSGAPFGSLDYCKPTPPWAVYDENAVDGGFDPDEQRFVRKGGATVVTGGGC